MRWKVSMCVALLGSLLLAGTASASLTVKLTTEQMRRIKCWTDLNCPLWSDYIERKLRPGPPYEVTASK